MRHFLLALLSASLAAGLAGCATGPCGKARNMTMMSLNIRMGCGLKDPFLLPEDSLGHLPECAAVIRAADPDWVAIQEIDRGTKRSGHMDQTAELAKLCGMNGFFVRKVDRPDGHYGLAILSKEKPLSVSKILMPGSQHTRCVEIAEYADYFVACTHYPLDAANRMRASELIRLNLADREKPVFLAGDFNALPDSPEIAELKKGFTILSDTSKPTFRADAPKRCLDYIMVDTAHAKDIVKLSAETVQAPEATDHCGIIVKAVLGRAK